MSELSWILRHPVGEQEQLAGAGETIVPTLEPGAEPQIPA